MTPSTVTTRIETTRLLGGLPLRDRLLEQAHSAVATLGVPVRLCIVQVGSHAPSNVYIRNKQKACAVVGITAEVVHIHEGQGEHALHATLKALAIEPDVTAVLVQTPLPRGWDVQAALNLVPAHKDVDGLSRASAEMRMTHPAQALLPATPLGVMRLLEAVGISAAGKTIAVIGKGMVVGAPLRGMLQQAGANVVDIDKDTPQPANLTRNCDVIIAAAGVPGLVTAEWVKPGATVIDVGLTRHDGKLLGDVNRMEVEGIAGTLTPVPGGVGPMTVASLITNICDAACLQLGRPRTAWKVDVGA
jgi:methylenetetrahydrofolate dehydrogenase (NADP+) / methenyltetrahydrofolate cyclohydrolase